LFSTCLHRIPESCPLFRCFRFFSGRTHLFFRSGARTCKRFPFPVVFPVSVRTLSPETGSVNVFLGGIRVTARWYFFSLSRRIFLRISRCSLSPPGTLQPFPPFRISFRLNGRLFPDYLPQRSLPAVLNLDLPLHFSPFHLEAVPFPVA